MSTIIKETTLTEFPVTCNYRKPEDEKLIFTLAEFDKQVFEYQTQVLPKLKLNSLGPASQSDTFYADEEDDDDGDGDDDDDCNDDDECDRRRLGEQKVFSKKRHKHVNRKLKKHDKHVNRKLADAMISLIIVNFFC